MEWTIKSNKLIILKIQEITLNDFENRWSCIFNLACRMNNSSRSKVRSVVRGAIKLIELEAFAI